MGSKTVIVLAMSCIAFLNLPAPADAQQLRVGTYEWPPYTTGPETGLRGIAVDIYAALGVKTGLDFQLSYLPLKRLLLGFRAKTLDTECLVNAAWREDYNDISVYSNSIMETANIVLMKKEHALSARSVADFAGKKMGCNLGYFYTDGFQEAFENRTIRRENAISAKSLLLMLDSDRLDAVILDQYEARYTLRELNLNPENFTVAYTFVTKSLLCIRLHTDKKELLPRLNEGIRALKADGTVNKILQAYIQ